MTDTRATLQPPHQQTKPDGKVPSGMSNLPQAILAKKQAQIEAWSHRYRTLSNKQLQSMLVEVRKRNREREMAWS